MVDPAEKQTEERVATSSILIYSSPVLGVFFANTIITFYFLKFSTDILLISPAIIGTILLIARIWDAVTDPAAGWLSDRTNTRLGRRRPWFLGSAIPFGLSVIMVWSPPHSLEGNLLTLWVGAAILLFYTAYTAFRVPHIAMGAELSRGYHDRTRVFGILQAIESIGMLSAAGALIFLERAEDPRAFARTLSVFMAAVAVILILLATWKIEERAEHLGRGGSNPWRSFRDVLTNPFALILIGVFFLEQVGFSALIVLMPYLSDYVFNSPGSTGIYIFSAIGSALLSIPFWIWASRRFGKISTWLWAVGFKVIFFGSIFLIGECDYRAMVVVAAILGFMNGCAGVVGPSLKADVVDWDEAQTGERKEGSYFAAWNFVQKAASGIAVWAVGVTLAMTGFLPNEPQGETTIFGMLVLASILPCILHLVALGLMTMFKLDETEHQDAIERAAARTD